MGTSFQSTQLKYVQEIKRSGTPGHLQLTVLRIMDICVFRTENSLSCWSSVTYIVSYGYRKVNIAFIFANRIGNNITLFKRKIERECKSW